MQTASIGETLRRIRQKRGFTQSKAARLMGISKHALSRHERDLNHPRKAGGLAGYARVYGESIEAIDVAALPFDFGLPVPPQRLPGTTMLVQATRGAPVEPDHQGLALDAGGRIVWFDRASAKDAHHDRIDSLTVLKDAAS